jgi:hypothetical protein
MRPFSLRLDWPLVVCDLHALIVTAVWILVFQFELNAMPGKYWMILSLSWFLWLMSFVISRGEDRTRWFVSAGIGALILVPTFSTTYTFVVWAIEGFAP